MRRNEFLIFLNFEQIAWWDIDRNNISDKNESAWYYFPHTEIEIKISICHNLYFGMKNILMLF